MVGDQSDTGSAGKRLAFLATLRRMARFQGVCAVAVRAGIPRETLFRALSPAGNPNAKTLFAVVEGVGMQLTLTRTRRTKD